MTRVAFIIPGNEVLAEKVIRGMDCERGELVARHFPDGESYLRVMTNVKNSEVIVFCTMHRPDDKWMPLYFLCENLRENGAAKIILVAPYLAYMRQDKKFMHGEGVTSKYFAKLISSLGDELITIEPHLHRWKSLAEIYSIPCTVLHPHALIASYISAQIPDSVLIGPDCESEQWVSEVAAIANVPYMVLKKERISDTKVEIRLPDIIQYRDRHPVLLDDIISTAHTMIEAVGLLENIGMKRPYCIGIHAVFAGHAFEELQHSDAIQIITCNTISHPSNKIDVSSLIIGALNK